MRFAALSLLFAVDGSQVDEEYHHTQLLQTKVQHPKVAVDAQGLAHDETVLLQSGVKMFKKARAQAVKAQFMRTMTKKQAKVKGRPGRGSRGPKGGSGGSPSSMGYDSFMNGDPGGPPPSITGGAGPAGGGPDNMGPGPDNMGPGPNMGGGPDNMGPGPNMGGGPDNMGPGPTYMGGGPDNMGPGPNMGGGPDNMGPGPTYTGGGRRPGGGRGSKPEDDGEEACKAYYSDRVEECMGCGHSCMEHHPCAGEECLHSEPFMMCHGECMGSPLGGDSISSSEGMQACMEFYPGREGECMECGGHCIEDFPCSDRDSCMASQGFMHCHSECMLDPEMGGCDEGERACKDYYPGEFDQCMECGGHCVEEHPCEGAQDCMQNQGFMHCHGDCMMQAWDPSNDPEVREGCIMFYGENVDVPQCFECGWGCTAEVPPEAWEDPNTFTQVMQCADQCMGQDNLVHGKCVEGYGEDVDVMQCISCGFMCGCGSHGCDEECHAQCMGSGHEEYQEEGAEECKEFYGKDVDIDKCLGCAEGCYEQAGEFGHDPAEWFNAFINCQDNCVGAENRATGMCKELGGEGVDITRCFTCGMGCCERLDDCKGGQGGDCMDGCYHSEEEPPQPWDTYSSGNYSSWDTYGNHSYGHHSSFGSNWSDSGNWSDTWDSGKWSDTYGGSNWSQSGSWDSSSWPSTYSFGTWDSSMGFDSFSKGDPANGPVLLFGRRVRQDVADGTDLMQVKKHLKTNVQK